MGSFGTCAALLGCGASSDRDAPEPSRQDTAPGLHACGGVVESLRFGLSALGAPDPTPYDGPAIVERSTSDELRLALPLGTAELAPRLRLTGAPLPLLPLGATLHLTKRPAVETPQTGFVSTPVPWAWTLREREGGSLLMGASWGAPSDPAAPLTARVGGDSCVAPNPSCSSKDAAIYHQSVEVLADEPVVFEDGEARSVTIDGRSYTVQASSTRETGSSCFADYYPDAEPTLRLSVVAQDLASLLEDVEVGVPPACSYGNDPYHVVGFHLSRTRYQGPAVYRGVDPNLGSFVFDVSNGGRLEIESWTERFRAPSPGTEYWVEYFEGMGSLRETAEGPLLLAGGGVFELPFDDRVVARLETLFDVPVHAERACDYREAHPAGDEPIALWDLVFETTPPTRIHSGEIARLVLAGEEYSAWFDSSNGAEASFSVFRER